MPFSKVKTNSKALKRGNEKIVVMVQIVAREYGSIPT